MLVVNVNPGNPVGGSGTQYFTGTFDGLRFASAGDTTKTRWADYGADFYAAVSWNDVPPSDGRRVWIGWMSNWLYGQKVPTSPWRSAMSVPRAVGLRYTPGGLRLVQQPVAELASLGRGSPREFKGGSPADASAWLGSQGALPEALDVSVIFAGTSRAPVSLDVMSGDSGRTTETRCACGCCWTHRLSRSLVRAANRSRAFRGSSALLSAGSSRTSAERRDRC